VGEHVRPAHGYEEISRTHLHLTQVYIVGRQELEIVERTGGVGEYATDRRENVGAQPRRDQSGDGGRIGNRDEACSRDDQEWRRRQTEAFRGRRSRG
jgi:hypothetical protein